MLRSSPARACRLAAGPPRCRWPAPCPAQDNGLLVKEMARVAAGEGMQAMDTARYGLDPPPPTKRNDYASWRAALDNAYAQLEHQYNRCV